MLLIGYFFLNNYGWTDLRFYHHLNTGDLNPADKRLKSKRGELELSIHVKFNPFLLLI